LPPPRDYQELAANLNLFPQETVLLKQALIHRSYSHETGEKSNERLEFLGDSVLSLVISDYLYKKFRRRSEGELSKTRAFLVSAATLARVAARLDLGEYIFLGTGEEKTGGRKKEALVADAMEALIAAVYLQCGWEKVKDFIINNWTPEIEKLLIRGREPLDPKTKLQELLQSKGKTPHYTLFRVEGPDHDRLYTVNVYYREKIAGTGKGRSKRSGTRSRQGSFTIPAEYFVVMKEFSGSCVIIRKDRKTPGDNCSKEQGGGRQIGGTKSFSKIQS